MEGKLPAGALGFKDYLTTKIAGNQDRISSHHIIPRSKLENIVDYKCKDKTTPFCDALFAGGVQELCGETLDSFLKATGNLFRGPMQSCRTYDPADKLETGVIGLMDCSFDNNPGTDLVYAYMALKNHLTLLERQINLEKVSCDANSETTHCINAAKELNSFYKRYCKVRKNPLYDLDFYLEHFWIEAELSEDSKCDHMFSLRKYISKSDCESIREASRLEASHPFFLESEAVVSNHFHKTKATDSSSFILDDSVDARF